MVTVPLILLAIPSLVVGWVTVQPVLFGGYFEARSGYCRRTMCCEPHRRGVPRLRRISRYGVRIAAAVFAAAGVLAAWLFFLKYPAWADAAERRFKWLHIILVNKYGFDWFNEHIIVPLARGTRGDVLARRR